MAMSYYCVRLTLGENIKIQKQTVPSLFVPFFHFLFFFDVVLTLEIGVVRKASEVFNTNPSRVRLAVETNLITDINAIEF